MLTESEKPMTAKVKEAPAAQPEPQPRAHHSGPLAQLRDWLARPNRNRAVRRFREVAESGDVTALIALLDPTASVVVDSGDPDRPTIRVVTGASDAAALLVHGMKRRPGLLITERPVNSQPGLILSRDAHDIAAMTIDFTGALVDLVWIRLHPEQLRRGNRV
jgi:hypothetical protein